MIDEVFAFGYNGPEEQDMIRWTKEEMHNLETDEGVLSLWIRYVTYWPPGKYSETKEELEAEALAQMAISKMLS